MLQLLESWAGSASLTRIPSDQQINMKLIRKNFFLNGADLLLPELWDGSCCFPKAVPASPHDPGPTDCVCRCCPVWKRAESRANPADLVPVVCCLVLYALLSFRREEHFPKLSFRDFWGCSSRPDDLQSSSPASGPTGADWVFISVAFETPAM